MRTTTMRARPLIVSDQAYTKLRMNIINSPITIGATSNYTIGGNYFASNTISTKQLLPVGLERWSMFYSQYTILGTKIVVQPIWMDPSVGIPIQYTLYPMAEGDTAFYDATEIGELPYSRYALYRGPGQSNGQTLSSFMSTNKILGQKSPYARIEDEVSGEFSGTSVLEPARIWTWQIRVTNLDDGLLTETQIGALRLRVKVVYYIRFFGRKSNPGEEPAMMALENKFSNLYLARPLAELKRWLVGYRVD